MWGKIFFLWMRNHRLSVEKTTCFSAHGRGKSAPHTVTPARVTGMNPKREHSCSAAGEVQSLEKIAGLQKGMKRGCSIRCRAAVWVSGLASLRPANWSCMTRAPKKACWYQRVIVAGIWLIKTALSWQISSAQSDFRPPEARSWCLFLYTEKRQVTLWGGFIEGREEAILI